MAVHERDDSDDVEGELDPAAERVRRKLARLLLGSLGIMVLGLVAVFSAILYRVGFESRNAPEEGVSSASRTSDAGGVEGRIALPAGTTILSTSLDEERALLHVRAPEGAEALIWLDLPSGRVLARHDLVAGYHLESGAP